MARQFDVYRNPDPESRESHPYLIVLQSDALGHIATRVVAPLVSPKKIQFFERLLPEVTVGGAKYVVATPDLGAIPAMELNSPIANLEQERDRIIASIDLLFMGI